MKPRACALTALAALLAGCAAGPDYERPKLALPAHYTEGGGVESGPGYAAGADIAARWWQAFGSPALDELVRATLANNPSVAAAQAALRSAQASVRAQRAAAWPSVQASFDATRQSIPGTLASPASSNSYLYNLNTAQLSVSYTPDVFGANARQVESLQAQADAQRWAAEATYLTLSSNVVAAAVQEAALREQIAATRKSIAIQRDTLARWQRLRELGQASAADIAGQEAALAAAESALPPLDKQLAQTRDVLKALAGRLPTEKLEAEFSLDTLKLPAALPLTLPSTLVEHRPDILAAEAQLKTASAAIGVAAAARLPSITLGVDAWGSAAYALGDLFRAGTSFWTLAGGVSQTVFDAGALREREAAARAAYDEAAALYKLAVINAFQNVADSLQAIAADERAQTAAAHAQQAAARSLAIARRQLELGDASALAVMQAEQGLLQADIAGAQARANRLADAAALFQSLGGGWWNRPERTDGGSP